jgi:hypothetical protein
MALSAKVYHKYRGQVIGNRGQELNAGGWWGRANQKANGKWQKSNGKSLRSSPSSLGESFGFNFCLSLFDGCLFNLALRLLPFAL